MALIARGIPWPVVFGDKVPWDGEMPDSLVFALNVVLGEISGASFNWEAMEWRKPSEN